jgi:hypothetical protein
MTQSEITAKLVAAQEREELVLAIIRETGTTIAHARVILQERER